MTLQITNKKSNNTSVEIRHRLHRKNDKYSEKSNSKVKNGMYFCKRIIFKLMNNSRSKICETIIKTFKQVVKLKWTGN